MLRIPHCLYSQLKNYGEVADLEHRPRSTTQTLSFCSWYSFLLEAEEIPESGAAGRNR
jgi:hypothetical protein